MKAKQKLLVLVNILLALIKVSIIYNISSFKIEWTLKNETVRWVNVYNITKLLVQFEKLFKREGVKCINSCWRFVVLVNC